VCCPGSSHGAPGKAPRLRQPRQVHLVPCAVVAVWPNRARRGEVPVELRRYPVDGWRGLNGGDAWKGGPRHGGGAVGCEKLTSTRLAEPGCARLRAPPYTHGSYHARRCEVPRLHPDTWLARTCAFHASLGSSRPQRFLSGSCRRVRVLSAAESLVGAQGVVLCERLHLFLRSTALGGVILLLLQGILRS